MHHSGIDTAIALARIFLYRQRVDVCSEHHCFSRLAAFDGADTACDSLKGLNRNPHLLKLLPDITGSFHLMFPQLRMGVEIMAAFNYVIFLFLC